MRNCEFEKTFSIGRPQMSCLDRWWTVTTIRFFSFTCWGVYLKSHGSAKNVKQNCEPWPGTSESTVFSNAHIHCSPFSWWREIFEKNPCLLVSFWPIFKALALFPVALAQVQIFLLSLWKKLSTNLDCTQKFKSLTRVVSSSVFFICNFVFQI